MNLLIVNYHYIREEKYEDGIYPRSVKEIQHQMKKISKSYEFISQMELVKYIDSPELAKNKNLCLITFDDGLKEQLAIKDYLDKEGIYPIYYVSTDTLEHKTLNVHKLHYIRAHVAKEEIANVLDKEHSFLRHSFDEETLKTQYRYDNLETAKLKYFLNFVLDQEQKDDFVGKLFADKVSSEKDFAQSFYFSEEDIKSLGKTNQIGSHGKSHNPLGVMSNSDLKDEIETSVGILSDICGIRIRSISYPFGGPTAIPTHDEDLKNSDLSFGLTMKRGLNHLENLSAPYLLNRVDTNDAPGGKLNSSEFIL